MITGNCYYFLNTTTENDYYRGSVKFRAKSTVYDRMGTLLENFTTQLQKKNPGAKLMYRSYRNEENYIFEVFIDSKDSNRVYQLAPEIMAMVKSDSIIRMQYYEKLDNINAIIKSQQEFLRISDRVLSENSSAEVHYDVEYKTRTTLLNIFNLTNMKANLYKDFEIYPFSTDNITFIHNSPWKQLIKINIILLVLGIFAIVIVRQFKN